MNIQEFFDKYNGKKNVGNTTENRGECVGLVSLWMDNFGIPHVYGHAKDLYANALDDYFAKIINTPDAIIQEGDIAVWGAGYNGTYGHTGIAKGKATIDKFDCFEQNDPLGSTPHIKTYNYAYIIGWLRPKFSAIIAQPMAQEITDQTKIDMGSEFGIMEVQAIRSSLHDSRREYEEQLVRNKDLAKKLNKCLNKPLQGAQNGSKDEVGTGGQVLADLISSFIKWWNKIF